MPLPTIGSVDQVPVLTRGDVTLRAHRADDAEAVVEQCTDPASVRWTTVPLGYDRAMADEWLGGVTMGGWGDGSEHVFAIECTHPDGRRRFGGTLSLRDRGHDRAEIAFGLHPAVRGRGVMATAVDLLLDHGFGTCGLRTVVWWTEAGNLPSRRVAWRAGFTLVPGTVHRWLETRDEVVDAWVGTLHRDDPREPTSRWLEPPVLRGDGLVLRPLDARDVDRVVEGCTDPRTRHWLEFLPDPYTRETAEAFVLHSRVRAATGEGINWAVTTEDDDDTLLGVVGVPRLGRHTAEIGYWMHPDARGRGVMTRAVALVLPWVHAPVDDGGLGRRRAMIKVAEPNTASRHVALANGFAEVGRERASEDDGDGTPVDMLVLDRLDRL